MKALCFVRLKIYKDLTSFNHERSLKFSVIADNLAVSSSVTGRLKIPENLGWSLVLGWYWGVRQATILLLYRSIVYTSN